MSNTPKLTADDVPVEIADRYARKLEEARSFLGRWDVSRTDSTYRNPDSLSNQERAERFERRFEDDTERSVPDVNWWREQQRAATGSE